MRALTGHPAFSFANPNRVRSLIGAFAQGNQTQFNRADGAGYEFRRRHGSSARSEKPAGCGAADHCVASWRVLEPVRRGRAEAALRRIARVSNLSRDVSDIVERSLELA